MIIIDDFGFPPRPKPIGGVAPVPEMPIMGPVLPTMTRAMMNFAGEIWGSKAIQSIYPSDLEVDFNDDFI